MENHHVVRRWRTRKRDFYFGRWNSEEAVLLQTQGREAAITFGKSASGAVRLLLSERRVGSTRRCDQSACSEAAEGGTFIFSRKMFMRKMGATRTLPLADGAQALAVPGRLKQYFSHTKIVPKKAAIVRPTEHLKTVGQLQC